MGKSIITGQSEQIAVVEFALFFSPNCFWTTVYWQLYLISAAMMSGQWVELVLYQQIQSFYLICRKQPNPSINLCHSHSLNFHASGKQPTQLIFAAEIRHKLHNSDNSVQSISQCTSQEFRPIEEKSFHLTYKLSPL